MVEKVLIFGNYISLYYTFWLLGVICVIVGGYYLGKHNGFGFAKSIIYVVSAVVIGYLLLWATSWVFGGGKVNGLNFVRVVVFLPIAIFIMSKLYKDKFGAVADFIAPLLAIFHGVTHIGCIFEGCCHGYLAAWGLFSNEAGAVCFPIQPIEAASSIVIGAVLALMLFMGKQTGKLYAWYLVAFGLTRFLWEFFRDNDKIWNGVSELALHALAAFIIGVAALLMTRALTKRRVNFEKK